VRRRAGRSARSGWLRRWFEYALVHSLYAEPNARISLNDPWP
jgi:hypothetical protein